MSKKIDPELEENEVMEPVDELDLEMRKLDAKLDVIFDRILKEEEAHWDEPEESKKEH